MLVLHSVVVGVVKYSMEEVKYRNVLILRVVQITRDTKIWLCFVVLATISEPLRLDRTETLFDTEEEYVESDTIV